MEISLAHRPSLVVNALGPPPAHMIERVRAEGTGIAIERFADVAIQGQIVDQIRLVDNALVRLDDGRYGQCEVCRKPIAEARLDVIPWAETCVACA